ncbi:MAG: SusC/RagA family TonB-linked outer membrane protein [Ekhidna sp.]|uniref:SusC/RagA family TonB-linked outer membrane protein n=1 Tax=Ekhidna sp. TaxID=2608089 RepID=UPI0032ED2B14
MKRILLLSFAFLTVIAFSAIAQRTVSGKVTDDTGESLPGVNVVIKGTTTGTTTDLDGNFRLEVEEGATLVFSFVGFETQEVQVGARTTIDISMGGATELQEVVVTAVGIERDAKALGISVESISADKIQQVSEPDPLRALQGKIAGVNISGSSGAPGSTTRITIRGNSSLLGNNQPLFVVDGIPYNNQSNGSFTGLTQGGAYGSRIADIDPNNIESINVLKGGAAAALYGTRASNGVVVITTKSGNSRAAKKGLEVQVRSSYAVEKIANLPDYQNKYGTGTNFTYQQANGSWGAPFPGTVPYRTVETIPHWYAGRAGFNGIYDNVTVPYQAYPDNVKNLFQDGSVLENSVTISGGGENSNLSLTATRTDQDGYVPNTEYGKTAIGVGGTSRLENGLYVSANLQYTKSKQTGVQSGVGALGGNNPSAFARALYLGRNWDVHGQPFENPTDRGSEFMVGRGQADNPLWSYKNNGFVTDVDRILTALSLEYDINDWLSASYKIGINTYNQRNLSYIRPGSTGPSTNPGIGELTEDNIRFEEIESNFILSSQFDINEDFDLSALVGYNVNQRTSQRQAYQGQQFVDFDILDLDNTNAVVPFGGQYSQRRLYGVYADVTLGYRDYAFLTLTARNDWSSTLPKGNNSFFYPAVQGSFILSEALGMQSNAVSNIKLRAAWSEVGSDTNPYQVVPTYNINNAPFPFTPTGGTTASGYSLSNIARDPDFQPERSREVEFGINAGFLNNKVNLDVTYYNKSTTNQIVSVALPGETGFTSLTTNSGEVTNEGVEITLNANPVSVSGFEWNLIGTFTHNKNLVVSIADGVDELVFGTGFAGAVASVHRPGQEYGLLRGSVDARDDEGNLLVDPANGQLMAALDPAIIGNPNPDFILGLTNSFSYKGITLSAVIDWRQGGDLYSNTVLSLLGRGVLKATEDRERNWIIPGVYGDPNTLEPIRDESGAKTDNTTVIETNSLYFGQSFAINASDEWSVFDATVIRLREVSIGYTFPKSLVDSTPFGGIQLTFTGRNLWYNAPNFPESTNFDPEVSQFASSGNTAVSNQAGIEYSATPTVKRYGVNLKLTF